jgi:hypothetical protein
MNALSRGPSRALSMLLIAATLAPMIAACTPTTQVLPIDFSNTPGYEDQHGAAILVRGDGLHTPSSTTVTVRPTGGEVRVINRTGAAPAGQKAIPTVGVRFGLNYELNPADQDINVGGTTVTCPGNQGNC